MKTVFTDISKIAHIWANKLQSNARTSSSNFYFENDVIYSYGRHFPIAKHIVNANGENGILFTERSYSVTTSKHISIVRQAASHKNVIYCYNPESSHDANFTSWQISIENIATKLLKAKKPEIYLNEISSIADRANKYADFFSLTIPESLQAAINIGNKADYQQYNEKKELFKQAENERKAKELKERHKKELAAWLKGETHRLYVKNGYDYLRVSDNCIETTQAVQIPLEAAKRLYTAIKDNSLTIGAKVLDYTVESIGKEISIGCHNFKKSYLLSFGSKLFS